MIRRHPTARRLLNGAVAFSLLGSGLVAAPAAIADPVPQASPGDSLILHYDFNAADVTGATVKDLSPSHLDGTISNAGNVTYTEGHMAGTRAISLPGGATGSETAPYITIPNGLFKDRSAMTISAWTKWDGGADFQWLYNLGKDNTKATFFTPSFADDHKARSSIKPVNGNAEVGVSGSGKLAADKWVNVTSVIDGKTITYYLNGAKVGSEAASIELAATMYAADKTTSGFIGKAFWGGHPFYSGDIDDFRVYSTALTGDQVAEVAGPEAVDSSLALRYQFDTANVSGTTVKDTSGAGLDGTIVNPGSAPLVAGHADGSSAIDLTGGGSGSTTAPYIKVPNGLFKDKSAVTISSWMKWDGGPDFQWLYVLGRDGNVATFLTPSFADDHKTRSSIKPTTDGAQEIGVPGGGQLPKGQWVNLTTVVDGKTITYYINGVSLGTRVAKVDIAGWYTAGNDSSGFIGKPFWGGHPFLDGQVEDFRVYSTALSGGQVRSLLGAGVPTFIELTQTSFPQSTIAGQAPPALPGSTNGRFSDGIERPLDITWDEVDPSKYAQPGTYTVTGHVVEANNAVVTALVTVLESKLKVDLRSGTGPFYGGASGTLYGVYGEGVPSNNTIDGIKLRTVSTKAQDGPQHPGADALEVVKHVADSSGGDTLIYMTDIYRGFPYEVPGSTGDEKVADYKKKVITQVKQALTLDPKYQKRLIFQPFNEPEGNMFGNGPQSFYKVSWLTDQRKFDEVWDDFYKTIKGLMPEARIAGPGASAYFNQIGPFLKHAAAEGTVPDVMVWHELDSPGTIRTNVARYRQAEKDAFAGTSYEGRQLPINLTEYANNYHTSVPGQLIQWVTAIEDTKVDGDLAYWNIDGDLSGSTVQDNRGNGQWWLLNAYSQMTGDTVKVTPPQPNKSYTLQGLATLDKGRKQAKVLLGGQDGAATVEFTGIDSGVFGGKVHALVQEIPWTGQLGDSAEPKVIGEANVDVHDGVASVAFGANGLPPLREESAYQVILTPGANATSGTPITMLWSTSYEAEKAGHTGGDYWLQGPEGSPANTYGTYTSGGYSIGGLRTGSDLKLNFKVDVPQDGKYKLDVFANGLNTLDQVKEQGPTNVYLNVDGQAEQQLYLPLGYKYVVWGVTDTTVDLTKGEHTITLSAQSLDGSKKTKGFAFVDKLKLSLPNPAAAETIYEGENADLNGAVPDYTRAGVSGPGAVAVGQNQSATFWVYNKAEGEATLSVDTLGGGHGKVTANGQTAFADLSDSASVPVYLRGGINKIVVTGTSGTLLLDRIRVKTSAGALTPTVYQAEDARIAYGAKFADYPLATGGKAATNIGGDPGNQNTLTFTKVKVAKAGTYALTIRYSNGEQSPATHYNPDPLARRAGISINGAEPQSTWFPFTYNHNNFWELTIPVQLDKGNNKIRFSSEELPNFDGATYISTQWPDLLLRSKYAPNIDSISVAPYTTPAG